MRCFSIPPNQIINLKRMFIKLLFLTTLEVLIFCLCSGFNYGHDDGLYKISNCDVIVYMDNCGFHHGRNTEPQLRAINPCNKCSYCFQRIKPSYFICKYIYRNVSLVLQLPYHPQVNTCEYCFTF